jgi:hypothetical protein
MNAKRLAKKFAAISMIAAMVVTAPSVAFAGGGSATSTGSTNGHWDGKKVQVTFTTEPADNMFEYMVDPEGWIMATSDSSSSIGWSKAGKAVTANAANVYFTNNGAKSGSAAVEAWNHSTVDVDLKINVKPVIDAEKTYMALTDAAAVQTAVPKTQAAALCMSLDTKHYNDTTYAAHAITDTAAGVTDTITLTSSAANFDITTSESAGYGYAIKAGKVTSGSGADFDGGCFQLSGICQSGGADPNAEVPSFAITWSWGEKGATSYALERTDEGGLKYTFDSASKPSGTFSAVTVNGVESSGKIGGNIKYSSDTGVFKIQAEMVTNRNLTQGNTTVIATIGGKTYTLTY